MIVWKRRGISIAQQPCQRGLAIQEWTIALILAAMLDEVEGIVDSGIGGLPTVQFLEL
jgi:hypothetical protein